MKHRSKQIPLNPAMLWILDQQKRRFRAKFGRDPGPEDPISFDQDTDLVAPMSEKELLKEILDALRLAKARPEIIYAVEKTGRLVTEVNIQFLTPAEYKEWCDAIDEYRLLHG